jgi:predicted nucleic acid-binding protein
MIVLDTSAVSALMHRIPEALSRLRVSEPADVVLCRPVAAASVSEVIQRGAPPTS